MKLLIVDDDSDFRETIARRLHRLGHEIVESDSGADALAACARGRFEVALIDLMMPSMGGIELLQLLKESDPACEVVMLTGEASVETAVSAMKQGAFDYLSKPCPFDELQLTLNRAWDRFRLGRENEQLKAALQRKDSANEIVGESPAIRRAMQLIEKVAQSESSVLILGESGTGKELAARAIHRLSQRAEKPLVTINCAALQETLLESELFGHEKGAFTSATQSKMGLFEVADRGTLFVDEIGEMQPSLQAKLLRVLEDGSLRRVGATKERTVDVRVVAATNKDLHAEVAAGRFRDDLFFRINVFTISLPPLRDRRDDIRRLAEHLLDRHGSGRWTMTSAVIEALSAYDWPGNVRELANVIERASILAEGTTIDVSDLPEEIRGAGSSGNLAFSPQSAAHESDNLAERERLHVERVLHRKNFSRVRTAKALGITRRSLYRLIKKYGIDVPSEQDEV